MTEPLFSTQRNCPSCGQNGPHHYECPELDDDSMFDRALDHIYDEDDDA